MLNFGQNLNEKDVLRLIVHDLNTKLQKKWYAKYRIRKWCVKYRITRWFPKFCMFFTKHWKITKELKSLKDDITYSTECESGMGIGGKAPYKLVEVGADAIIRTKKSRSVADAREIEMRLINIFKKLKFKIVVVFDELDKIEQGEIPNTKASIFSINAMRARQTEILRILSNMKYFLSTAKAKFIFIAGREMYDMYLADVSERGNYISSIFNSVIYVPSFLTDYADDTNSDITSLTEEFVCRKLIPDNLKYTYIERKN